MTSNKEPEEAKQNTESVEITKARSRVIANTSVPRQSALAKESIDRIFPSVCLISSVEEISQHI
jgi:hypothetical protein